MKIFLFIGIAVMFSPICCFGKASYEYIGCFKDEPSRAMPVLLKIKTNLIEDCEKEAAFQGYKVYGVQNQFECWSGPTAHSTYNKYGESTNCKNGKGWKWTNSVYRVLSDGAALAASLKDLISNAASIDDIDVGAFVASSSKLLNRSSSEWRENPKMADNFLSASEGLLSLGMNATTSLAASNELMVFSISKADTSGKRSLTFPDYNDPTFSQQQTTSSFVVPTINNSNSANIGGFFYSNLHERVTTSLQANDSMFRSDHGQVIVSKMLSCQVNPPILYGINTNDTISITLEHLMPLPADAIPVCGFWKHSGQSDNSSGIWSTEGCNVISWNRTHTRSNSEHLTNFAILMQFKNVELADDHRRALTILTNIGCSLSLVAIFMTVAIYLVFGFYRAPNFHIHINLCFAIALSQIFLLFASQARDNKATCVAMSAFLHYFCLCVFTWMLVEGLQIYKKVVSIFSSSLNLIHCHLIGWGFPIPIVVITYVSRPDNYTDLETCWLSPDYGIRWAFIGPVLAIITINVCVTIITLRKRLLLRSLVTKEISFKLRTSLRALFVLLPIFGITWLIGIFGFTSDAVAAMYIFVILNASQGLLIFIFHAALNVEVRKTVAQGRRMRIHTRNGTLSQSNKTPLKNVPSKNSDVSNQEGSARVPSGHSDRSNPPAVIEQDTTDDLQLVVENVETVSRSTHVVP